MFWDDLLSLIVLFEHICFVIIFVVVFTFGFVGVCISFFVGFVVAVSLLVFNLDFVVVVGEIVYVVGCWFVFVSL